MLATLVGIGLVVLAVMAWQRVGPWPVVGVVAGAASARGWVRGPAAVERGDGFRLHVQPDHSQVTQVTTRENEVVQNHFASIAEVKPGLLRRFVLKTVFAPSTCWPPSPRTREASPGSRRSTFARWVVVDGGRNLLFLSNYDGSWENYLDDFIDRASSGLTAIWSNTVGFPKTSFLVNGGARDELLFKILVRRSQMMSLVWYSAYPDSSTQNIQTNAAIREGLFAPMNADEVREWLKNF